MDGTVEAVRASLQKLTNEEVRVCVIHAACGGITEGDVTLAAASNAIIVGFNVRPDRQALDSAERQGVEIRTYRVIYECIEEIEAAMKGMLAPKFREKLLGHAEVRQTIRVPSVGTIAGCYITDGKIARSAQIRIVRDGVVIQEDKIASLRRFKDDVKEVAEGRRRTGALQRYQGGRRPGGVRHGGNQGLIPRDRTRRGQTAFRIGKKGEVRCEIREIMRGAGVSPGSADRTPVCADDPA